MITTTTDFVPNKKIRELLGIVRGNTIRSRGVGGDIVAGIQKVFGGEISAYVVSMNEAREEALRKMEEEAQKLGADAVLNVRFTTGEVMPYAAEILAYGTAVKLG
ncbi:MAG: YbjQ family protein [Candidatus Diapherotrites archaeon]|uniref:UPF0145 protein HY544_05040 n=1 Tax=Candidatus Iainarchaeum sp. TaxID=3101447 RepID=A0A8T3YKT4_9ARCH|nr:YbjQ family protein [Candidatus Diapherotrites archaeon]